MSSSVCILCAHVELIPSASLHPWRTPIRSLRIADFLCGSLALWHSSIFRLRELSRTFLIFMSGDTNALLSVLLRLSKVVCVFFLVFCIAWFLAELASAKYKVPEDKLPVQDIDHPGTPLHLSFAFDSDNESSDFLPSSFYRRDKYTKSPSPEIGDFLPYRRLFYQNLNNSSQYLRRDSFCE